MGLGPLGSRNLSTDSIGFLEVPKPPMDILELLGQQSQTGLICPVCHHEASCECFCFLATESRSLHDPRMHVLRGTWRTDSDTTQEEWQLLMLWYLV